MRRAKNTHKMVPEEEMFVPYDTIFKLEERRGRSGELDYRPRKMVCLNCNVTLDVGLFLEYPELHLKCNTCKVTAEEYWKDRLHRKVVNATIDE